MCSVTIENFTVTKLLRDPLTQMAMRSDGVSEEYLAALLYRIKDATMVGIDPISDCGIPSDGTEEALAEAAAATGLATEHVGPPDTTGEWLKTLAEG